MREEFGSFERSLLTDTRTFRRGAGDDIQASLLGVAATFLYAIGAQTNHPSLLGLGAVVLYATALLCSIRARLLAPVLFVPICFALPHDYIFPTLRLACFAVILGFLPRTARTLMAVYTVAGLWAMVLTANYVLIELDEPPMIPMTAGVIVILLIELIGVLALQLLCWTRTFTRVFLLPPRQFSLSSFSILASQASSLLGAAGAVIVGIGIDPFMLQSLADSFYRPRVVTGVLLIFLLPALLSLWLSRFLRRCLALVREGTLHPPTPQLFLEQPVLHEFREVQNALFNHVKKVQDDAAESTASVLELRGTTSFRATTGQSREELLKIENIALLGEHAPWGLLALNAQGAVVATTKKTNELLGVVDQTLLGKTLSTFRSIEAARELTRVLGEVLKTADKLVDAPARKFVSTVRGGDPLEFTISVVSPVTVRLSEIALPSYTVASPYYVLVYIRTITDLRHRELDVAGPTPLEIAGANALNLITELAHDLSEIGKKAVAAEKLSGAGGGRIGRELAVLFGDICTFVDEAITDVHTLIDTQSEASGDPVEDDLAQSLRVDLDRLAELTGQSPPPPLNVEPVSTLMGYGEGGSAPAYRVNHPQRELNRLHSYVIAALSCLLRDASDLELNLASASLSPTEAEPIRGARAGDYVQLTLSFKGVRLPTTAIPDDFRLLIPPKSGFYTFEGTLIALGLQLSRMKGFLTCQNLAAQGSRLVLYIPRSLFSVEEKAVPPLQKRQRFHTTALERTPPTALAICGGSEVKLDLAQVLFDAGFLPRVESTDLIDRHTASDDEDASMLAPLPTEPVQKILEASSATLLLLSVEESPTLVIPFLATLERANPGLTIILIVDETAQDAFSRWIRILRPVEPHVLREALQVSISPIRPELTN